MIARRIRGGPRRTAENTTSRRFAPTMRRSVRLSLSAAPRFSAVFSVTSPRHHIGFDRQHRRRGCKAASGEPVFTRLP